MRLFSKCSFSLTADDLQYEEKLEGRCRLELIAAINIECRVGKRDIQSTDASNNDMIKENRDVGIK